MIVLKKWESLINIFGASDFKAVNWIFKLPEDSQSYPGLLALFWSSVIIDLISVLAKAGNCWNNSMSFWKLKLD